MILSFYYDNIEKLYLPVGYYLPFVWTPARCTKRMSATFTAIIIHV